MTHPERVNSMQPSEEADAKQLEMARAEGQAYEASLKYMANHVAHTGATQEAGQYLVGYAQEKAEAMWHYRGEGQLELVKPQSENCHLEISVADVADRRFIPYLTVHATLKKSTGETVGPFEVPFVWHPGLYHYGKNLEVPGDGTYDLHVRIEPPRFMRHDKKNGERYARTVEVDFRGVQIKTGQG